MASRRIFLSYAHDELPFVQSVAVELGKRGLETGFEARDTQPGGLFSERLGEALRASSAMVVFIGESPDSQWMNFEIGAAMGQAKTVLPIFLNHDARHAASPAIQGFRGIDASELKPDEIADEIAEALAGVPTAG